MVSASAPLASQVRQMRDEIKALRKENGRMKAKLLGKSTEERRESRASLPESSTTTPSYLRPTAASANRAVSTAPASASKSRKPVRYILYGSFLRPTLSSKLKAKPNHREYEYSESISTGDCSESKANAVGDVSEESSEDDDSKWHSYRDVCNCPECTGWSRIKAILRRIEDLKQRTRFDDKTFYITNKAACAAELPFKIQMRILREAYRQAQEALWHAVRMRRPDLQIQKWPQGPAEVLFEGYMTRGDFDVLGYSTPTEEALGLPDSIARSDFGSVVELRNRICHPRSTNLSAVDDLISRAQDFAAMVNDEGRARRLRRLRDEVQVLGVKEIQAIESHLSSTDTRSWAIQHQKMCDTVFGWMRDDIRRKWESGRSIDSLGKFAVRAARAWKLRHRSVGLERPEYKLNVARKEAHMRQTQHGRQGSISASGPPRRTQKKPSSNDGGARNNLSVSDRLGLTDASEQDPVSEGWDAECEDSGAIEGYPQFKVRPQWPPRIPSGFKPGPQKYSW